ncbi:MAG: hypothetical protein NTV00_10690 [Methylococcales bacterium]|nr:hypothetical protein [Methylococcales bacterium]
MVFLMIALAMCLIIGSALVLLRTANIPKIPPHIKAKPYQDDQDE